MLVTVIGGASDGADFGGGSITSEGDQDGFIARFASDGALRWQQLYGGTGWDIVYQIAADAEAVVVGDFLNPGASVDVAGTTLLGPNQALIRVEADGSIPWLRSHELDPAGEAGFVQVGVSVDGSGRVDRVVTGTRSMIDVGGGPLAGSRSNDIVIGAYDPDGTHRWSMRFGGRLSEQRSAARRLATGELILTGEMLDQLDWGGGVLMGDGRDMFILRFAAE